jgi:hypothetical protein
MSASVNRFTETVKNIHLGKSFTEGGIYKASASINQAQPTNLRQPTTMLACIYVSVRVWFSN